MKHICIATEDRLSECVAMELVSQYAAHWSIAQRLGRKGAGYLKRRLGSLNAIADKIQPVLLLTDLDTGRCAPGLIRAWRGSLELSGRLLFRVAVREVEAWLLADRDSLAEFLGISLARIPRNPETLDDPKAALLSLARKSRKRSIRQDLLPERCSPSPVGLNYNSALSRYVEERWRPESARLEAPSLERTIVRICQMASVEP
jgi:hypothetical protein